MSNLAPSVVPFQSGLDLQSPKIVAQPGSLLSCLNYEIVDLLGYRRIDGFQRYDGNVSLKDIPNFRVVTSTYTGTPAEGLFEDEDGNYIGYVTSVNPGSPNTVTFISFTDSNLIYAYYSSVYTWKTNIAASATAVESTISVSDLRTLEQVLRDEVVALPCTPVGLHWFRNYLVAVVPQLMVHYKASNNNQVVSYTIGATINSSFTGTPSGTLLDKVITTAASASGAEEGYFIVQPSLTRSAWTDNTTNNTYTLSGAVSVGAGSIYHQADSLDGMTSLRANIWFASRPATYRENKALAVTGWTESGQRTFTVEVTLSGITDAFNRLRDNDPVADCTYYFSTNGTDIAAAIVIDYYIVSGSFATGDAVLKLQISNPLVQAGAPGLDFTTSFDMYSDAAALTKVGDVTARMTYNCLPGYPLLKTKSSRYKFKTSNFYAADGMDAVYGVNGAGRGFILDEDLYLTHIWTQEDEDLDMPRDVENHHGHLALSYLVGSVLLSAAGSPHDFQTVGAASEIAVGDRVTGIMSLQGTTLGVFCEQSIWAIVGTQVDDFQTQVIAPNTGCIEYTLADCGFPVYMDTRGMSTLETSAKYGDFVGSRLSAQVSPFLAGKCRSTVPGINNSSGIACAIPVRNKNQYRVFFNDGEVLTATFQATGSGDNSIAFTTQRYYLNQSAVTDINNRLVPFAWTSEMDITGTERIYMAHYNEDSPVTSDHVYEMESGISFDGNYIPHEFETNWYFGEAPTMYRGIQKIRIHGLSRGYSRISVYAAGIDNDYGFGKNIYQTTAEPINLPRTPGNVYNDLLPVTNIANLANRGLGVQLKFKGSNTTISEPEPSHVMQAMVVYSRPTGGPDA